MWESLIPPERRSDVIYFFSRHQQFLRCEIQPGSPHVLTLIDHLGVEHTERLTSAEELEARWTEMRDELARDGWMGPFGRDGRG
jgi:hypothetical protein